MLTALGGCKPQLEMQVNASLNVSRTLHEIVEAPIRGRESGD
jgi:hypothetical protein